MKVLRPTLCVLAVVVLAACTSGGSPSHTISGGDRDATDPGNTYRVHGDARDRAYLNAHDGAIVYAEDRSDVTADGGIIYASSGASVQGYGQAVIYYVDGAHISLHG